MPYTNPQNDAIAMERAPDRYRYVLDRPLVHEPGEVWNYNGGATAVIGHLITVGTGKSIDVYAKEKLFEPLGVGNTGWTRGSDGTPWAASGLRMTARDLAKIGLLLVNNGKRGDRQIVPRDWIRQSLTPRADRGMGRARYGYFWWLAPAGNPPVWVAGFGNGGQRLHIDQLAELVVVVFAGNYNSKGARRVPNRILRKIVAPAVFRE